MVDYFSEYSNDIDEKAIEYMRQSAINTLFEAAEMREGWEFAQNVGNSIKSYTKIKQNGLKCVCGKARVNISPKRWFDEVTNYQNWKNWDPLLREIWIQHIDDHFAFVRLVIGAIWPVSSRDAVYLQVSEQITDGSFILCSGTLLDFPDPFPIDPNVIRVDMEGGGWHLKPVEGDPNQCDVTYFASLDPKLAYIPYWIINMVLVRFPGIIDKVKQAIEIS